jgi:HAD superfamily hydrolase (TIGR01509 family)
MKNKKLIIFDLDGVLVDARELHYQSMNLALEKYDKKFVINRDEHLSLYDARPTSKKLSMLTALKGLPKDAHQEIWQSKQEMTRRIINTEFVFDEKTRTILKFLKKEGYKVVCASNATRETVKMMLLRKGFIEFIDFFYSNEDVKNFKPSPEIYLRCMIKANASPKDTIIFEDSHIGREAALKSGANLCAVMNNQDLTLDKVKRAIQDNFQNKKLKIPWKGGKMNVLIPMAGAGSRFSEVGYVLPKPLIEVNSKPMIQLVTDNLNIEARHVYVVQKEHYEKYNLKYLLNLISPNCEIVQVEGLTEGAACTTLLAKKFINNDEPLVICNSDQVFDWNSNEFMYSMTADEVDAGLLTFEATHPKWSFAKLGDDGFVNEVAEKNPISNIATAGVYYWKKGSDYVKYAEQMIAKDIRTNGEFYVCPVYNEAVADNKKIKIFQIEKMWGLGTPEDLEFYLKHHKE